MRKFIAITALSLAVTGCSSAPTISTNLPPSYSQTLTNTFNELQNYWTIKLSTQNIKFNPPPILSYDPKNTDLSCGGEKVDPNNALYCSESDKGKFIGYDSNYMQNGYNIYGPALVYFIFAHEYGHAAQDFVHQELKGNRDFELQADCLGGAFISEMINLNHIHITQVELDQMTLIMAKLGDDAPNRIPPDNPENGHGTGAERYNSFYKGFTGSIPACNLNTVG